jgi:tRNA(Ile)-lysidine synthase
LIIYQSKDLLHTFTSFFTDRGLPLQGTPYFIAASGGVDSSVLCELAHKAGLAFTILHCNFQLRGAESERDETFVRSLGAKYGVEVIVHHFDTTAYAAANKLSIQEAARDLRYNWFRQLVAEGNYKAVLLAHHSGDQVETVLMNFFRGTGWEGLKGMKESTPDGCCLRPMLAFSRSMISNYAQANGIGFVEDSSNSESKYTRNFFRNELIPSLKNIFPQVEENLLSNLERFKRSKALYQAGTAAILSSISKKEGRTTRIPVRLLQPYRQTALMFEWLHPFGFNEKQVAAAEKLLDAGSGKYISNAEWQVIRHRNWLVLAPVNLESPLIMIGPEDEEAVFPGGKLSFKKIKRRDFSINRSPDFAQLDLRLVDHPLVLRKWRTGDYFYPFGQRKKKKLSRFFIDSKLSKAAKESAWVLESGRKIVWVAGMRIDDRFRITESTKEVLVIRYHR